MALDDFLKGFLTAKQYKQAEEDRKYKMAMDAAEMQLRKQEMEARQKQAEVNAENIRQDNLRMERQYQRQVERDRELADQGKAREDRLTNSLRASHMEAGAKGGIPVQDLPLYADVMTGNLTPEQAKANWLQRAGVQGMAQAQAQGMDAANMVNPNPLPGYPQDALGASYTSPVDLKPPDYLMGVLPTTQAALNQKAAQTALTTERAAAIPQELALKQQRVAASQQRADAYTQSVVNQAYLNGAKMKQMTFNETMAASREHRLQVMDDFRRKIAMMSQGRADKRLSLEQQRLELQKLGMTMRGLKNSTADDVAKSNAVTQELQSNIEHITSLKNPLDPMVEDFEENWDLLRQAHAKEVHDAGNMTPENKWDPRIKAWLDLPAEERSRKLREYQDYRKKMDSLPKLHAELEKARAIRADTIKTQEQVQSLMAKSGVSVPTTQSGKPNAKLLTTAPPYKPKPVGRRLDRQGAAFFLREAGGDVNKARSLAKQRGFSF